MTTSEVNVDAALRPSSTSRVGTLTVMSGLNLGAIVILDKDTIVIGSEDDSDIVIEEDGVSHHHACIHRVGRHFEIEDLGSKNGTFIAGVRIQGRTRLVVGARIFIANCMLRFGSQDALEAQTAKRVYDLSVRDEMTQLYNRRYLDQRLISEVAFARRQGTALGLLLCDVDLFKRVNDRLGHQAGDHVLHEVASVMLGSARTEDVLARTGGEEFAVIVRGVDVAGTRAFADRMRKLVERSKISWLGHRVPVTVSIGISHNQVRARIHDADAMYASADKALYAAKKGGRNQCHLSRGRRAVVEISSEVLESARNVGASIYDAIRRSSN